MKLFVSYFGPSIAAALAVILLHLSIGVAYASDAGACYTIGDSDQRAYCLAKARGEPGHCYAIQRADLRSMCLAEVRR